MRDSSANGAFQLQIQPRATPWVNEYRHAPALKGRPTIHRFSFRLAKASDHQRFRRLGKFSLLQPHLFVGVMVELRRVPAFDRGLEQEDVGVVINRDQRRGVEQAGLGLLEKR